MRHKIHGIAGSVLVILMVAAFVGCSTEDPVVPSQDSSHLLLFSSSLDTQPPCTRVQFSASIATIDADQRLLTFGDNDYTVAVPEDCPVIEVQEGVPTELGFGDLQVGDFVKVCGTVQEDGSVVARMIVVYPEGVCVGYDVCFQDTLATIDYGVETFTVKGRTETLITDENTVIWGKLPYNYSQAEGNSKDGFSSGTTENAGEQPYHNRNRNAIDTVFVFSDLQPGYLLEIKAKIIDETTLLAVEIKVLGCNFRESVQFEDYIASIDYETGDVTFDGNDWLGTVCPGAALLDSEGGILILEDFAAGDKVAVKGVPLPEEDLLKICVMAQM